MEVTLASRIDQFKTIHHPPPDPDLGWVLAQGSGGVVVVSVRPESVADLAGIKAGMLLRRIDGREISSLLDAALAQLDLDNRAGSTIEVEVGSNSGASRAFPVTLPFGTELPVL